MRIHLSGHISRPDQMVPCRLISHDFFYFPYPRRAPERSFPFFSKYQLLPAIPSLLPDTGYEKPLRLIPSTIQLSTWLPHTLTVVLPPLASLPHSLPPLPSSRPPFLPTRSHFSILLHPLSLCISILRLLWNQFTHVDLSTFLSLMVCSS